MIDTGLYVEAYASMRCSSFHELSSKTVSRCTGNRSPYENRNHAAACDGISQAGRRDGAAAPCRAASWAAVR
jgi:hypothetical protein